MLAYEKLDVYQRAIEFLSLATDLIRGAKRGDGPLVDQLRRASMSAGFRGDKMKRRSKCVAELPWTSATTSTITTTTTSTSAGARRERGG